MAWKLDGRELSDVDEGRTGVIVRDMVDRGEWLLPRTTDGHLCEKPLVHYWLSALTVKLIGRHDWALRSISVVMALATLAVVWMLARLYGTPRASMIAVLALASNQVFLALTRTAMVDMTLTFFVTAGLASYFAARHGHLRPWTGAVLAGVAFALAALTKGPLGIILPGVVIGGDWLISTRGRFWASVEWTPVAAAAAIALLLPLAWYLPAYLKGGREFLETSVLSENFRMPIGDPQGIGVGHKKPLMYYPVRQLMMLLPMAILVPELLAWLFRRDAGPARAQMLAWAGFGLALFLAASNQRSYYLLPLQPAFAVMLGVAFDRRAGEPGLGPTRWGALAVGIAWSLAGLALFVIGLHPAVASSLGGSAMKEAMSRSPEIAVLGMLALVAGIIAVIAARRSAREVAVAVTACAFVAIGLRVLVVETADGDVDRTRTFVAEARAKMPVGEHPVLVPPIPGYGLEWYWPEPLVRCAERPVPRQKWLIIKVDRLKELPGAYAKVADWYFHHDTIESAALMRRIEP